MSGQLASTSTVSFVLVAAIIAASMVVGAVDLSASRGGRGGGRTRARPPT